MNIVSQPLALFGGEKAIKSAFPHSLPVSEEELKVVAESLKNSPLSTLYGGYDVDTFENSFKARFGYEHCIAVNSGTSALHAALVALGVKTGDEVITTTYSFVASVSVIVQTGAIPIFCDINPHNLGIDVQECSKLITSKTKAIIAVHIFGTPMEIAELYALCKAHKIALIEDCAGALGAKQNGRYVGSWGDISCFSFNIYKLLRTGEGGMVVTADRTLAEKLRELRVNGLNPIKGVNHVNSLGFNYTMPQVIAAIGSYQLSCLPQLIKQRENNLAILQRTLHDLPLTFLKPFPQTDPVPYYTPILLDAKLSTLRIKIIDALEAEGVPIHKGYGEPLYKIEYLADFAKNRRFIVTEDLTKRIMIIDPAPYLSGSDMKEIALAVRKVFNSLDQFYR